MNFAIIVTLCILNSIPLSCSFDLLETEFSGSEGKALPHTSSEPQTSSEPESRYFNQRLDHFDEIVETSEEQAIWLQRYWRDDKYYEKGGPVYLMLPDRATLDTKVMNGGYWHKHGKENKAMFFYITHRFYDREDIVADSSRDVDTESLMHLTVSQAVVDFADFIRGMNRKHQFPEGTKWIIFGSSYAGNLAAWMRTTFPDLVHAAVASSAPVLAKVEIPEYLDNVGKTLASYSKKCKNDIAQANRDLDKMMQSPTGRKDIGDIFYLCSPLDDDKLNASFFAMNTVKYISDVVQNDLGHARVKKICDKMLENVKTKKPIQRYSQVILMLMDEKKQKCLPTRLDTYVKYLKSTKKSDSLASGRTWLYQQCQEFGWFPVSRQKSNTFSKNVDFNYFINLCSKVFDKSYNKTFISEAVDNTNKLFKGLTLNTTRTLFIHGNSDPWKFAQITSNKKNTNLDIITIKKGSHCSDIYYSDSNKKEMVDAIQEIERKLNSYLEK